MNGVGRGPELLPSSSSSWIFYDLSIKMIVQYKTNPTDSRYFHPFDRKKLGTCLLKGFVSFGWSEFVLVFLTQLKSLVCFCKIFTFFYCYYLTYRRNLLYFCTVFLYRCLSLLDIWLSSNSISFNSLTVFDTFLLHLVSTFTMKRDRLFWNMYLKIFIRFVFLL